MRLPDLAGYQLEKLMGEDPFGWNFLANRNGADHHLVRVLKSQATQDHELSSVYRSIGSLSDHTGIAPVEKFRRRSLGVPSAVLVKFPGWQGEKGNWHLSSIDRLSRIMDKQAAVTCATKMIDATSQLHNQQIYHGGIHSKNIFFNAKDGQEPVIELTGFGEMVTQGLQHVEASTLPFYLAPEQLQPRNPQQPVRIAQWDVYAIGVVIYQLLTGHLPRLDRLYQQYRKAPEQMDRLVLIAGGRLTPNATQIHKLLGDEHDLIWPDQPLSQIEKSIRQIVEKCLYFDNTKRFGDMTQASHALQVALENLTDNPSETLSQPDPTHPVSVASQPAQVAAVTVPAQSPTTENMSVHRSNQPSDPMAKNKAAKKASKKSTKVTALEELFDEEVKEVGPNAKAEQSGNPLEKIPFVRRFQGASILDKSIALLVAIALLGLGSLSFIFKQQSIANQASTANQIETMRAEIENQNSSYQRVIADKAKSTENLQDNLEEEKDIQARLMGETTLARELVRQTQANGDRFFRLVLENKDTDVPSFRNSRNDAIDHGLKYYQQLIEVYGDAPDFMVSTANAYHYLGRIHKEMGRFKESEASFNQSQRLYIKLMEGERNVDYTENLAIAQSELGDLALRNRDYAAATGLLNKSSGFWKELVRLDPQRNLDSIIEVNSNALQAVRAEHASGNSELALKKTEEVAAQFLELQESHSTDDRVIGGLANSFELLGNLYETQGSGDKALKAYQQASDLYAGAIKNNASVDQYHLGLGNSLARTGILKNDFNKLRSSADVLGQVIARNPFEPTYISTMAEVFGLLAANQRDGGKKDNAIKLEQEAISLLKPVLKNNQIIPDDLHHSYASRLVHLAELQLDSSKFSESRAPLKEAIGILNKIATQDTAVSPYRRTLATAKGLAGFASLKSGDKSTAKNFYESASSDWKTYLSQHPNDSDAANNAKWTNEQLKSLKWLK